jgi:hypothetical protein
MKGKTPQNSSLPPSTQHPHARPQPPKHKSKKKRGGQPGHEKHERPSISMKDCDDMQPVKPTECPCCGETTCAELPLGVPQGQSGPRRTAFTALLTAFYRQSKPADGRVPQHAVGSTMLPGADGENAEPSDGGLAAVV